MKNGFFQSISGNRSSSRLYGFIVIIAALIFTQEIIYFGRNSESLVTVAAAAGTLFITIAGPAMAFLFYQKKNETKTEQIEN